MNNIILIGRLTKDAEARQTQSGKSVCTFNLAVDRRFKDQDGNSTADFFKCTAWGNLADNIAKYTHKGSLVGISGEMQNDNWDDENGVKHFGFNLRVDSCQFLSSKNEELPENAGHAGEELKKVEDDTQLPF